MMIPVAIRFFSLVVFGGDRVTSNQAERTLETLRPKPLNQNSDLVGAYAVAEGSGAEKLELYGGGSEVYDTVKGGGGRGEEEGEVEEPSNRDVVDQFLSFVEQFKRNKDNCTPGTTFSLGDGVVAQYGVRRFRAQAMVAVNRANFLTRVWKFVDLSLLHSEYFLYSAVRSMVEGDDDVFAAGNCYDQREYKNYSLFCPYAYRLPTDPRQIMVKDLSVEYKYLGNDSEFFYQARVKAGRKVNAGYNETVGYSLYRYNDSAYRGVVGDNSMQIEYEDGHWSKPYFDCRGGDIWMMTYTVPFFGFRNGSYYFKGTSGIDIDLQKVDIDQCPLPSGSQELNVFAGSNKCKQTTTKCVPVPGQGFRRGSYRCECRPGFYFPDHTTDKRVRFFNGSDIEAEFERKQQGKDSLYDSTSSYVCLACAVGCDVCEDDQPCVLSLNWMLRSIILTITCFIIIFIPAIVWFTFRFENIKVLKAASPVLLRIILLGAFCLYCPMITDYFDPTEMSCSIRVWMREIGFSISYGALLLKTWRISVVFRVRSAQRIKISDADLIKRLSIIVLIFVAFLAVRTIIGRPIVTTGYSSTGLRTYQCHRDVWDYCTALAELCLLLWGIRLCIMVRKAPSEFNESRFISWAIYNETLLSLFLNITMLFLQSPANPDILYLVLFFHSQLTTTVTLSFLFGSKAYVVYKCSKLDQIHSKPTATSASKTSLNIAKSTSNSTAGPAATASGLLLSGDRTVSTAGDSTAAVAAAELINLCSFTAAAEAKYDQAAVDKDIRDEFRRLYVQLELLKQKNMRLNNPHLGQRSITSPSSVEVTEARPNQQTGPFQPVTRNGQRIFIGTDNSSDSTCV